MDAPNPNPEKNAGRVAGVESNPLRVLVVDDDRDTVDSAAVLLRHNGYNVETALNGREAVGCAQKFQPHVVMLDLAMPHVDGYQTAVELQRLDFSPAPVLIAVSGQDETETGPKAAAAGFDLCLTKPIESAIYEYIYLLAEQRRELTVEHTRMEQLRAKTARTRSSLVATQIETVKLLLDLAKTTSNDTTKARCVADARLIISRLASWTSRYPNLRGELQHVLALSAQLSSARRFALSQVSFATRKE